MHLDLPHPSTVVTFKNEAESPTGDSMLSGHLRAMELDHLKLEQQVQLPSIEQLFGPIQADRRQSQSSVSTATSCTSGSVSPDRELISQGCTSTRRLSQIVGQLSSTRTRSSPTPDRPMAKIVKAYREKGARKVQCGSLSKLQNALLFISPELPHTAHGKGWKELRSNNINSHIANALRHRKNDVLDSSTCMVLQQRHLLHQMLQHIHQSGDAIAVEYFSSLIDKLCTDQFPELPPEFMANL